MNETELGSDRATGYNCDLFLKKIRQVSLNNPTTITEFSQTFDLSEEKGQSNAAKAI